VDREEALRLLRSGPEGIGEWNTYRLRGEKIPSLEIPSLRQADLRQAHLRQADLSGAVLSGADLRRAVLSEAVLSEADLSKADLRGADLSRADLSGTVLSKADLSEADLKGADLSGADLRRTVLSEADLRGGHLRQADLSGAHLRGADLRGAVLRAAHLSGAVLGGADLSGAHLRQADLSGARVSHTNFGDVDLSEVEGLETITHGGPSTIGVDTLIKSQGKIPEAFLRGCGVPPSMIGYLPFIIGAMQPIQFYSCFISHSSADKDFAHRLHSRLRDEGLRVWFDEEHMKGGRELHPQIDEAIRFHDKLLLVLSEASMKSKWVATEIRRTRVAEGREGRRKFFPIRLVDYELIRMWRLPDSSGEDLAEEVRKFFIPDFTGWKDHNAFESAFERLLRDLKAEGPPAK
jgi:uncharacterized protein YjbI with pentapeptide repeats